MAVHEVMGSMDIVGWFGLVLKHAELRARGDWRILGFPRKAES